MPRLLLLCLIHLSCLSAVSGGGSDLAGQLEGAMKIPALRKAKLAALVVRERDGAVLYAREADRALVPASNQKVLTAVAALAHWGPAHRFVTRIEADLPPNGVGEVASLCVRGGGDPLLTSEQWWRLAANLRLAGLTRITGDVFLDASAFDGVVHHPSWGQPSSRAYFGPVAALSANYGAFEIIAEPVAKVGKAPRLRIDPPVAYLVPTNRARTVAARKSRLAVVRQKNGSVENIAVSGTLSISAAQRRFARSVADPVRYAGSVFDMQLSALGISRGGDLKIGSGECGYELEAFEGPSLATAVRRFLKWSNNAIGETLLKGLGRSGGEFQGSWDTGVQVARRELEALGVDLGSTHWVDGSGLSRENRVSPRTLVRVLTVARNAYGFAAEFESALPIGGADGTLKDRAADAGSGLRAKTGLLTGVAGLCGYARSADGERLVFAVLTNGFETDALGVMAALDRFAAVLTTAKVGGDS